MATARTFVTMTNLIRRVCQDESSTGQTMAQDAVNEVIKQIQMEINPPGLIKGEDATQTIGLTATTGTVEYTLASDILNPLNVWYVISGINILLLEVKDDREWLRKASLNIGGTPLYWNWIPASGATAGKIRVWPAPNSSFISQATNLKYSYIAQLGLLSASIDVPAIPYEHDKVLVSGGIFYMAMMQGDKTLMQTWEPIFEMDFGNLRAWYSANRFTEGVQMKPDSPMGQPTGYGTISRDYGRLL